MAIKLSFEKAKEIRELYGNGNNGYTQADLAEKFGVGETTISHIVNRLVWIECEEMTFEKAQRIRKMYAEDNYTQVELAREFGAVPSEISYIISGRLWKEPHLEEGEAAFNKLYRNYQGNAKRRGLEWALTKKQFRDVTGHHCLYCGAEPAQVFSTKDNTGDYIYNGVDRLDSDKGYIPGNVVPCCKVCNQAKSDLPAKEFLDWIRHLCAYQGCE